MWAASMHFLGGFILAMVALSFPGMFMLYAWNTISEAAGRKSMLRTNNIRFIRTFVLVCLAAALFNGVLDSSVDTEQNVNMGSRWSGREPTLPERIRSGRYLPLASVPNPPQFRLSTAAYGLPPASSVGLQDELGEGSTAADLDGDTMLLAPLWIEQGAWGFTSTLAASKRQPAMSATGSSAGDLGNRTAVSTAVMVYNVCQVPDLSSALVVYSHLPSSTSTLAAVAGLQLMIGNKDDLSAFVPAQLLTMLGGVTIFTAASARAMIQGVPANYLAPLDQGPLTFYFSLHTMALSPLMILPPSPVPTSSSLAVIAPSPTHVPLLALPSAHTSPSSPTVMSPPSPPSSSHPPFTPATPAPSSPPSSHTAFPPSPPTAFTLPSPTALPPSSPALSPATSSWFSPPSPTASQTSPSFPHNQPFAAVSSPTPPPPLAPPQLTPSAPLASTMVQTAPPQSLPSPPSPSSPTPTLPSISISAKHLMPLLALPPTPFQGFPLKPTPPPPSAPSPPPPSLLTPPPSPSHGPMLDPLCPSPFHSACIHQVPDNDSVMVLLPAVTADKAATAQETSMANALLWLTQEVWAHRHTLQPAVFSVLSVAAYLMWLGFCKHFKAQKAPLQDSPVEAVPSVSNRDSARPPTVVDVQDVIKPRPSTVFHSASTMTATSNGAAAAVPAVSEWLSLEDSIKDLKGLAHMAKERHPRVRGRALRPGPRLYVPVYHHGGPLMLPGLKWDRRPGVVRCPFTGKWMTRPDLARRLGL